MGQLLLAKPYVDKRKKELKEEIIKYGLKPKLVIVRVGDDYASQKYVTNKVKLGTECGVEVEVLHLLEEISQEDLLNEIQNINLRDNISGCLIQLPLPKHINENLVLETLKPELDVDGFARNNLGGLLRGEKTITACTPKGIINLLKYYNIPMEGKDVLIINRSTIVGKPLALLFLQENATVTIAHSKTTFLHKKMKDADIIITAIGKDNSFYYGDFRDNQTIVDVSINFDMEGKICGDVYKKDYEDLINDKHCNITPVPGGVGLLTVLSLIENVLELEKLKNNL